MSNPKFNSFAPEKFHPFTFKEVQAFRHHFSDEFSRELPDLMTYCIVEQHYTTSSLSSLILKFPFPRLSGVDETGAHYEIESMLMLFHKCTSHQLKGSKVKYVYTGIIKFPNSSQRPYRCRNASEVLIPGGYQYGDKIMDLDFSKVFEKVRFLMSHPEPRKHQKNQRKTK